jgi:hypothetical protein
MLEKKVVGINRENKCAAITINFFQLFIKPQVIAYGRKNILPVKVFSFYLRGFYSFSNHGYSG